MEKKTITYEQAIEKLEKIVDSIESGEQDIDTLAEKLKEAKGLIKVCEKKLTDVDREVNKILGEDK